MKTLIIIPTYNEAENVDKLIGEILADNSALSILVVDDNSPDRTSDKVLALKSKFQNIELISRDKKEGIGSAYARGFEYAIDHNFDFVIQMDADFSHDFNEIRNFLSESVHHDLVVGSRYLGGIRITNWPIKRLVLSVLAARYTRFVTGMKITDPTSGFNGIAVSKLRQLDFKNFISSGYVFQIELKYRLWKMNAKIKEIPITFKDRINGKSKMNVENIGQAIVNVIRLRLKNKI